MRPNQCYNNIFKLLFYSLLAHLASCSCKKKLAQMSILMKIKITSTSAHLICNDLAICCRGDLRRRVNNGGERVCG